jgi:hypothetical protein
MKVLIIILIFVYSSIDAMSSEKYYIIVPVDNRTDSTTIEMYNHLLSINKIDSCKNEYTMFSYSANYHSEKDKSYFGVIENKWIQKRPIQIRKDLLKNLNVRHLKYLYPLESTFTKKELLSNEIELFVIYERDLDNEEKQLINAYKCSLIYLVYIE